MDPSLPVTVRPCVPRLPPVFLPVTSYLTNFIMSDVRPTTFSGATSPDASALLPFVGALLAGVAAWFVIELSRVESIAMDGKFLRYGKGSDAGPWGPHSAPIDWCEPNYAVHSHVAEWNNTLSCLAYILVALLHARSSTLFAFFVFMTGTTSALFHATLWWWGQKLDEGFENAALVALYHVAAYSASRSSSSRSSHDRCVLRRIFVHVTMAFGLIIAIPIAFAELHLVGTLLGLFYHLALFARDETVAPLKRRACLQDAKFAAVWGLLSFAAWLVDKVACEAAIGAWTSHVAHAIWHLGTAAALHGAGNVVRDAVDARDGGRLEEAKS